MGSDHRARDGRGGAGPRPLGDDAAFGLLADGRRRAAIRHLAAAGGPVAVADLAGGVTDGGTPADRRRAAVALRHVRLPAVDDDAGAGPARRPPRARDRYRDGDGGTGTGMEEHGGRARVTGSRRPRRGKTGQRPATGPGGSPVADRRGVGPESGSGVEPDPHPEADAGTATGGTLRRAAAAVGTGAVAVPVLSGRVATALSGAEAALALAAFGALTLVEAGPRTGSAERAGGTEGPGDGGTGGRGD